MDSVDPEQLAVMRDRHRHGTRWAAYQNQAMDSSLLGRLQFLHVGVDCTFDSPPERMPDTAFDTGWKYVFVGYVNMDTGEISK